jgi:hypothetical protein
MLRIATGLGMFIANEIAAPSDGQRTGSALWNPKTR